MSQTAYAPKIGIVSGIGPLAGSDVFAKVLKHAATAYNAVEDNEYPDVILINHGIEGVDNTAALNAEFENAVLSMVQQLEEQKATIIGVACNTAHVYIDKIKTTPGTTVINLIHETARQAASNSRPYLLLTSNATKQQKLYHGYLEKYDVTFQGTTSEQQELLDEAIGLVMAHKLDEAGKLLHNVLKSAKDAGFEAVIAGCTELPIAIDHCNDTFGLTIINSNQVLAEVLTAEYYSAKGL